MTDEEPNIESPQPGKTVPVLIAEALEQQTLAWEQGTLLWVEQVVDQQPTLSNRPEVLLDLIQNEIDCRRRSGQKPELDDYLTRFPQFAERLKTQWPTERISTSEASPNPTSPPTTFTGAAGGTAASGLDVPEVLGNYKILDVLGRGGMGAVYLARHELLGKTVALKVLSSRFTGRAEAVARFKREMKAVGALSHPNIVQAFDAGEIGGIHYIAMELIAGTDLHRLIREKGPLPVADACAAVCQVASALAAAHQIGLVHRDVKPSNMMITEGQIKLLDLGLARLAEADGTIVDTDLTSVTQTFGTPDFMAPEQWDSTHSVDHRTDLYALGCTLFFLLVGRPPYGSTEYVTASQKMKGHLLDPIPDLKAIRDDVPDGVIEIYKSLLAKTPDERFSSAAELRLALVPFGQSGSLVSLSSGMGTIDQTVRIPDSGTTLISPSTKLPKRSSLLTQPGGSGTLLAAGGLLLVLLICVVYWLMPKVGDQSGRAGQQQLTDDALKKSSTVAAPAVLNGTTAKLQDPNTPPAAPATPPEPDGAEHTLELWKLITRNVVSDGRFENITVAEDLITFDATGASRQLWLDFQQFTGSQINARMQFRIKNPEQDGVFKIVFLTFGSWDEEYYFQVTKRGDEVMLNLSFHDQSGQKILVKQDFDLKSEFYDISVDFTKDQIKASLGGKPVLEAPRARAMPGTPAIAVSGWQVEIKRPVVLVR